MIHQFRELLHVPLLEEEEEQEQEENDDDDDDDDESSGCEAVALAYLVKALTKEEYSRGRRKVSGIMSQF